MRQTHERILEALLRVMADGGLEDLSLPALARQAGVSVATIYRHFGDKRQLVLALAAHALQGAGMTFRPLESVDDLLASVRDVVLVYASDAGVRRAVATSEQSADMREGVVPLRYQLIDTALAPLLPTLTAQTRAQLRAAILLLTTSSAVSTCVDLLGMSGEEAADTITWSIQAVIQAASHEVKGDVQDDSPSRRL
jgi:AcrR family transcriptional regulator